MPLCFSDYKGLWYTHGLMEPHNYVCVLRGGRLKLGVGKGRKQAAYFLQIRKMNVERIWRLFQGHLTSKRWGKDVNLDLLALCTKGN